MRIRRTLVVLVVALVATAVLAYLWRPSPDDHNSNSTTRSEAKGKLVLIWWDTTKSLYASEQQNGLDWSVTIISNLPTRSVYYLLPINSDTQRPLPLAQGEKPVLDSANATMLFRGALQKRITDSAAKLKKQMDADAEAAKSYPSVVQRDMRTCLLFALEYSGMIIKNETRDLQPEIIFISDMVEDCFHQGLNSGKGGYIQLTQPNIDSQLRAADTLPLDFSLKEVWLTVIVPTASSEVPVVQRPDMNGLRRFWQTILEKRGLSPSKYQWAIGILPPRLATSPPLDTLPKSR